MKARARVASAARLVGIVGLAAALAAIPARADEVADRAAAVTAATERATHWLDALDAGAYSESWKAVAAVMQEGRREEDWISDVAGPRAKLGQATRRALQHADFATTVRGAPQGNYVTATYLSQFAEAPPTVETVLLTLENGQWRVAGYNVAPESSPTGPATPAGKAGAKP